MSTLPYLPGGVDELPAERFLVFADGNNKVQRFDESATTADGVAFTGLWESVTLNRGSKVHDCRIQTVTLFYSVQTATTLTLGVSVDGGRTWTDKIVNLAATVEGEISDVTTNFNLCGKDIRIRIQFDQAVPVKVFELFPSLIYEGGVEFSTT